MVSAAASWMDNLKLSMREIKKKYTKSELVMMAWDSKQKSYNMSQQFKHHSPKDSNSERIDYEGNSSGIRETKTSYTMPADLNNGVAIPKKFFDEAGEIDLRQATGPEALGYMRAIGFNIATRLS